MVQVFIKDQRRTPSEKLVEVMKLGVIKGDHAGKWCVHAEELWRALQDSESLIRVSGKST
jgi:hypothetical protein